MQNDNGLDTIFLDMDGVIVDCVGAIFELYGVDPLRQHEVSTWDGICPVLTQILCREDNPMRDPELWFHVANQGAEFWADMRWTPVGREVYEFCRSLTPNVVIMSTPTRDPSCAAGKLDWIASNLPRDAHREYALTPCKGRFARPGALLVDDGGHNVTAFRAAGGLACLFPAAWNDTKTIPDVDTCLHVIQAAWSTRAYHEEVR